MHSNLLYRYLTTSLQGDMGVGATRPLFVFTTKVLATRVPQNLSIRLVEKVIPADLNLNRVATNKRRNIPSPIATVHKNHFILVPEKTRELGYRLV